LQRKVKQLIFSESTKLLPEKPSKIGIFSEKNGIFSVAERQKKRRKAHLSSSKRTESAGFRPELNPMYECKNRKMIFFLKISGKILA